MLSSIDLNDKTYEQIREEAIGQIPIYSRDWTNYNISDPGITILENFSAFFALQQSEINNVPENVKKKLLELVGFQMEDGKAAKAFISLSETNMELPYVTSGGMKLHAQDICFELEQDITIKDIRVVGIRASKQPDINADALLERHGVRGGLYLFGNKPTGGETIYLYLKDIPESGKKAAIYVALTEKFHRNPLTPDAHNPFAQVKWEIKTKEGYLSLKVEDYTCCFLQSGYIIFTFDKELCNQLVKRDVEDTYVVRCTIERADYDIVPCFERITGLLIEAVQKDTRSEVINLPVSEDNEIKIKNEILRNGYLEIYAQEEDGQYHRYYTEDDPDKGDMLRHCRVIYENDIERSIMLDGASKEIMAICRDEEVMAYRSLGTLYGYDEQIIRLPNFEKVYKEDFSVIVVEKKDGDCVCHLVKPEDDTVGEVNYSVKEADNTLIIHDCGYYEGAQLRLGNFATYLGDEGNILADTELAFEHANSWMKFTNCMSIRSGRFEEDIEQLRKRFAADVRKPFTMITQADCEQIVKNIPGLSIHKIGIWSVTEKNEIHIAIKSNSNDDYPVLSDIYKMEIYRYLDKCRLLTTKLFIEQPIYVPIHATGMIYVKKHFENSRAKIEENLRIKLDSIQSDAGFGSKIIFHEIYRYLETMDCVDEVSELSIFPDNYNDAQMSGLDIKLAPNALYCPGKFRIEIIER